MTVNTDNNLKDEASKVLVAQMTREPSDFESAITATGFGKFNYLLLLVALIASVSNSFGTTTMSYVVPVAECDLGLTLKDKGMLNASGYLGTLCSIFLWGFLADTYGRRKLQIWGQWMDTLCNIGCVCSQSFWMLFIFKYFSGFTGSGPYTILMSYISEFHGSRHRSKVMVLAGVFLSAGNLILPFIAWCILPMDISINLYFINLNSWRLFLAICTLPQFLAALGHILLPESPKFLMANGQNKKALEVFQKIYETNSGKCKELYPVKVLVSEREIGQHLKEKLLNEEDLKGRSNKNSFRNGLIQSKSMFRPPYLLNFILVNLLQFGCMLGSNTLRLWLPQFFTTIDEYQQTHNYTDASLCEMLSYKNKINFTSNNIITEECIVNQVDNQVYINSIIVSFCAVFGYLFVGTLINLIGKKYLLVATFLIASISGLGNYWSENSFATLTFSSLFVTLGGICIQVIIAVSVELFPTSLRTMVISMTMIFGRLGAMLGNILFPMLLEIGCLPPFLLISGITLLSAIVALFLPKKVRDFS